MIATHISNINMNICINKIIIIIELKFIKVINKCPAIILAVNRIDREIGRINILIVSIIVIKGVNKIGVLRGIRWAIIIFEFLYIDIIIKNIQNGKAKVKEKIICLEDEKIYGNKLKKLFKKINVNSAININDGDLVLFFLCNINISLFNILNILIKIILIRFGIIHIKLGIIKIIKKVLIQLSSKFIIIVAGSKILNKFIIIFY